MMWIRAYSKCHYSPLFMYKASVRAKSTMMTHLTFILFITPLCILHASCFGQEPQEGCRALEHCLTNVDTLRSECKNKTSSAHAPPNQDPNTCVPGVKKKLAKLDEMQAEQRRQYRDCLLGRMKLSIIVNGKEKQDQCKEILLEYKTSIVSLGQDTDEQDDSEESEVSKTIRTRQIQRFDIDPCSKQVLDENLRRCNALVTCCSEATFCELEYQLTTLHDDIALQQMLTFIEMRRCLQREVSTKDALSIGVKFYGHFHCANIRLPPEEEGGNKTSILSIFQYSTRQQLASPPWSCTDGSIFFAYPKTMLDSMYHEKKCTCTDCYNRKTLPGFFVVLFDFLFALGSVIGIVLCTHYQNIVLNYCPRSISHDIMTQALVVLVFFAASIFLLVGIWFKFTWTMGIHILKDGMFLIVDFILLVVNVVSIARNGRFTLYDGAVLACILAFAALHAWFIYVMISIGNYILISTGKLEKAYEAVKDMANDGDTVYV